MNNSGTTDIHSNPPYVLQFSVSPSAFNIGVLQTVIASKDTFITATVAVNDADGPADIKSVEYIFLAPNNTTITTGVLRDNGITPDQVNADGNYTANIQFPLSILSVGLFNIKVFAVDNSGAISTTALLPITIFNSANQSPVLSNLVAPSIVTLSDETQRIPLTITVADSNGLSDIQVVLFNSYLPNGSPSSRNPFYLYDDGGANRHDGNTDAVAGDGIYSLTIELPPNTNKGTYRFEFEARDYSNARSNVIIHTMEVR